MHWEGQGQDGHFTQCDKWKSKNPFVPLIASTNVSSRHSEETCLIENIQCLIIHYKIVDKYCKNIVCTLYNCTCEVIGTFEWHLIHHQFCWVHSSAKSLKWWNSFCANTQFFGDMENFKVSLVGAALFKFKSLHKIENFWNGSFDLFLTGTNRPNLV